MSECPLAAGGKKARTNRANKLPNLFFISEPLSSLPLHLSFLLLSRQSIMSHEGINPLRPYYIPPSGLSPANAPTEVKSASSTQVFGSTARDLVPDLDYGDYLDSSSSVSDWARDVLNRALLRYTHVLTAQPFDVAKTILQVYVPPDTTVEWESDPRPTSGSRPSGYDSVLSDQHAGIAQRLTFARRNPNRPTMRAVTSPPLRHQLPRGPRGLAGHGTASPTAAAIFDQTRPRPQNMR